MTKSIPESIIVPDALLNDDFRNIVPKIENDSLACAIIDPPYGEGFDFDGDESVEDASNLLLEFTRLITPKIRRLGHVAVFWPMRTLDACIDSLRMGGLTYCRTIPMYIPKGGARPYLGWLPRTQAIVIAKRWLPTTPSALHQEFASWLDTRIARSSFTKSQIAKELGCNGRLVMKWTRPGDPAWCLPTPRFYKPLKQMLGLDDTYDIFLADRPKMPKSSRNDYNYRHDIYKVDKEWDEERVHPTQKPLSVVKHLVHTLADKGETVFDGFAGSGTTAIAAALQGRGYICVEKSAAFYEKAIQRIRSIK